MDSTGAILLLALVQGADGNFYGTTEYGGTNGDGTVFRMTTNGALTTLLSFNGFNGAQPYGALVQGTDGNFYGTTPVGGTNGDGTAVQNDNQWHADHIGFRSTASMALPAWRAGARDRRQFLRHHQERRSQRCWHGVQHDDQWHTVLLVSFDYTSTGGYPAAGLVRGTDGNFYGTTEFGGTNDSGTVFSVTTNGTLTTLVSFDGTNGSEPVGALVQGADGYLYGTTEYGGTNGYGTVFRMTTNGALTHIVLLR